MKKLLSMAMVMTLALSIVSCSSTPAEETPADTATETPAEETPAEDAAATEDETSAEEETVTEEEPALADEPSGAFADGTYKAEGELDSETGYTSYVEVTVVGGEITEVVYDGVKEDGTVKSEASESGEYGMVAYGNASSEWHEQALLLEEAAVAGQGAVDTVSGVTIAVDEFTTLLNAALEGAKN